MNDYYVYAHRKADGHIFYVGKGRGLRIIQTGNRNLYWKRIARKHGYNPMFLEQNLTETEAYGKEVIWIKHYKKTGQCDANFTNGGDGIRVNKRWWNAAISKALKGRPAKKGRESKSFKDTISKRELTDLYVNKRFSSVEIAKQCGVSYTTVISRLREHGLPVRKCGRDSVKIRCLTDNREFMSISDAAKHYNLFRENIRKVLNGKYKHTGGKVFEYVSNDREIIGSPC
jgi:hypothetical protein